MSKGQRPSATELRKNASSVDDSDDAKLPGSTDGSADGSMDGAFGTGMASTVRRRISSGALLLGGVVGLAALSLWSMRAIDRAAANGPTLSKETGIFIDTVLNDKSRKVNIETDASTLLEPTDAAAAMRVPLKDLSKNPFLVWNDGKPPAPPEPPGKPPDTLADRIKEWQEKVDSAAAAIRLQSTMSGNGPNGATGIANVSGHMMRIGDVFGVDGTDVEFSIEAIERDQMSVRAYNAELKHERTVVVVVAKKR